MSPRLDTADEDLESSGPVAFPGAGLSGARNPTLTLETAKRRAAMRSLLSNGLPDEDLARAMAQEFGMTEVETEELKGNVAERMVAESDGRKPVKRALAEARLHRHIASASKRGAWGAVANLEAQLARIQGTEEVVEQRVTIDARFQSATLTVLGNMSPEAVVALVAEEARRLMPGK